MAEVTVEALRGEIRIVAEGVTGNGRKIEANRIAIGENGRRIDSLAVRFDRVELRIGEHEARLTRLEQEP